MRNVDCAEIISQTDSFNLLYYSRLSGLETTTSSLNSLCFRSVEPIEPVEPIAFSCLGYSSLTRATRVRVPVALIFLKPKSAFRVSIMTPDGFEVGRSPTPSIDRSRRRLTLLDQLTCVLTIRPRRRQEPFGTRNNLSPLYGNTQQAELTPNC